MSGGTLSYEDISPIAIDGNAPMITTKYTGEIPEEENRERNPDHRGQALEPGKQGSDARAQDRDAHDRESDHRSHGQRQRIADRRTFECLEEGRYQDADVNQIADLRDRVARTRKRLASPGRATRLHAHHDEQLPDAHEEADRHEPRPRGSKNALQSIALHCRPLPRAAAL